MQDKIRQAANVVALLGVLTINGLANALPINGLTTGELSDRYDVLFVPASYVFSIWGLIYAALIGFIVYQALPAQRDDADLRRIGWWFVASSVANVTWIFLWHYEQIALSLVAMLALLVSLIVIYTRLGIGRREVSTAKRWLLHAPFSLYLGWITVATIANAATLLVSLGWNGGPLSPAAWTVVMLGVALVLAAWIAYTRGDAIYLGVLVWAFVGIALKHADAPLVPEAAWAASVAVVLLIVVGLFRDQPQRPLPAPTG